MTHPLSARLPVSGRHGQSPSASARLGMPVAAHSWDVVGSVKAGVDAIEHIWSVGYSSIPYAPARRKLAEDQYDLVMTDGAGCGP